jgi:hypothetical protein
MISLKNTRQSSFILENRRFFWKMHAFDAKF